MRHVPNLITFSRIGVLIALVWLVLQHWTGAATLAFFCILYGSVSDFLDGYIARKYNLITNFGKIMDATVDKVMTLGSFVLLVWLGILQPTMLAAVVVALIAIREIGITLLRFIAARRNFVLAAEKSGKRKTIWQTTSICVFFAVPMFERDFGAWLGTDLSLFGLFVYINAYLYFVLATYLTIGSGITYLRKYSWVFIPGSSNPESAA
jgi:CDP-diacylglycerol--glycerol-3-phosphate 3-phosphatidyltransferase